MAEARQRTDSALGLATVGGPQYGDALYWRALAGQTPDVTRRDLMRVAVDYPVSPRFPDALVKLAEIESATGNRTSARRRLERVVRDHLDSGIGARAALALGMQLLDEGSVAEACAVLDSARAHVGEAQVELANRIAYTGRQCAQRMAAITPPPPRVVMPPLDARADSSARPVPPTAERAGIGARVRSAPPATRGPWTVQVAAHRVRGDALRLEARLRARGYDVRIVGAAPYRVRIGKFATRAEAVATAAKLKAEGTTAIVVEAERS